MGSYRLGEDIAHSVLLNSFSRTSAEGLGVEVDDLLVSQPDCGEMALDIVDQLVRSSAVDVVVVDSVAALVPRAELEGDMR